MAKVSKYLLDMKELPPEEEADSEPEVDKTAEAPVVKKTEVKKEEESHVFEEKDLENSIKNRSDADAGDKESEFEPDSEEKSRLFGFRDIMLGIINVASLAVLIFLLIKFPVKAKNLSDERSKTLLSETGITFEIKAIKEAKDKADEISKTYVDEGGLVKFVGDLEKIKSESGTIKKITFTSQKAISDRATDKFGIPVVIEFAGDMDKILADIDKIESLPYIFRAITVDITKDQDNPSVILFKYGGLLYVNDNLSNINNK